MSEKKSKPFVTKMVMINLHISFDSGRRTMKGLSKKIADDNNANAEMLNTTIKLIPSDQIKPFTTAISRARQYYLSKSLPWEDGNWRVVPVTKVQQVKDDLDKLISEAKDEFSRCFINKYDDLKKSAEKRKGKIVVDFPSKEEIEDSFKISYNIGAIASSDDIRIMGIDTAMRKKIENDTETRYQEQLNSGLKELAGKLSGALESLTERVEGDNDDQKGKKYTKFIENLKDMAETVDDLNVTGNKQLAEATRMVRENISNWSADAIKQNPQVRSSIKEAAGTVQDQLQQVSFDDTNEGDAA